MGNEDGIGWCCATMEIGQRPDGEGRERLVLGSKWLKLELTNWRIEQDSPGHSGFVVNIKSFRKKCIMYTEVPEIHDVQGQNVRHNRPDAP